MSRRKYGAPSPETELKVDHLIGDVARRSRRGGAILLSAQAVRLLGQIGTLAVLARLLPPSAFGLLAMVAAIGAVLDLLKEFGLSAATIQKSTISHAQLSNLFWINAAAGLVLAAGLFLSAPLLARFYGQPELSSVTRWMSLTFVASGFTVQHWALLRRQMRFVAIAGLETAADLAGFAAGIAVALADGGYWALVAQRLVTPLLLMSTTWIWCRWRPARPVSRAGVGGLLRFGASVTASQLAIAFSRSIDQILIGWLWGPAVLGLYERATRLLMLPVNTINAPIYGAAMPAMSRLAAEPDRYRALSLQVLQKIGLLTMPAFALTFVNADWLVEIVFGPSWREAAPLAALFSLIATYLPVQQALGLLYLSQARTKELLLATLADAALCVAAILAGLNWGAVGVAGMLAAVGLLVRLPLSFWLATRFGPVRFTAVWRAVAPPATAALAVTAALGCFRHFQATPGLAALVVTAALAVFVTLAVLALWPETRREMAAAFSSLLPLNRRAVGS
jgi:PST family polysaccharide transporter